MSGQALILPVIMCGGAGTRLWPVSTEARPKPFHGFGARRTLFQATALRVAGEGFLPPVVVCGVSHRGLVETELAEIGVAADAIVLEPLGRGTAPLAAVAARLARERHPGARVLLAPADHAIADETAFRRTVFDAVAYTDERIVTFGVEADRVETGYGYIKTGERLGPLTSTIDRFVEKPDAATAEQLLKSGNHVWNAGIFLFSPEVLLAEMAGLAKDVDGAAGRAFEKASFDDGAIVLDAAEFAACPDAAIDRAVMEKTDRGAVAACRVGWTDVGAWNEIWRLAHRDPLGVATHGPVTTEDCGNALVWSDGPPVAVLGLSDIVVVAAGGGVLVAPKSKAQAVRTLVEALKASRARRP
jgi:mannose-1-phosphate guanylyltransferase/mannose-6-phosphate isomerase